jgi:hypothetical protein
MTRKAADAEAPAADEAKKAAERSSVMSQMPREAVG